MPPGHHSLSRNHRWPALAAVTLSFFVGAATQHFREAHAQSAPAVSSLVVPSGGLLLRSVGGRPIARISQDEGGGVFELYDAHGEVARTMSASARTSNTSTDCRSKSASFSSDDPFDARACDGPTPRPGPGF